MSVPIFPLGWLTYTVHKLHNCTEQSYSLLLVTHTTFQTIPWWNLLKMFCCLYPCSQNCDDPLSSIITVLNFFPHQTITSDCWSHLLPSGCTSIRHDCCTDTGGRLWDASLSSLTTPLLTLSWPQLTFPLSFMAQQGSTPAVFCCAFCLDTIFWTCLYFSFKVPFCLPTSYSSSKRTLQIMFHLFSRPSVILLGHDSGSPLTLNGSFCILFAMNFLPYVYILPY